MSAGSTIARASSGSRSSINSRAPPGRTRQPPIPVLDGDVRDRHTTKKSKFTWAIAKQGNAAEGIALIQENLADMRAAGAMLEIGSNLALLAEAQMCSGDSTHALQTLGEASTVAEQEIFQPHLLWMRGEVLLRLDSEDKAEQAFRDAIAFSRGMGDKMGELRAATSLARVLKSRGEAAQAQELLAPAFAAFVEGFDTP